MPLILEINVTLMQAQINPATKQALDAKQAMVELLTKIATQKSFISTGRIGMDPGTEAVDCSYSWHNKT